MVDLFPTLSPAIATLSALVQTALVREGRVEEALQQLRSCHDSIENSLNG